MKLNQNLCTQDFTEYLHNPGKTGLFFIFFSQILIQLLIPFPSFQALNTAELGQMNSIFFSTEKQRLNFVQRIPKELIVSRFLDPADLYITR